MAWGRTSLVPLVAGRAVEANNRALAERTRRHAMSPVVDLGQSKWDAELRAEADLLQREWRSVTEQGCRLPLIEQVLDESQDNDGPWRAALLIAHGRPVPGPSATFPLATAAARRVPGMTSALLSVLEPGTELGEHTGNNHGVLRYHLGIDCGEASALIVGDQVIRYRDGHSVMFDDTFPHAASNRGETTRVTLFCEVAKPLGGWSGLRNRATQRIIATDPRYRMAALRATEFHAAFNPNFPQGRPPATIR